MKQLPFKKIVFKLLGIACNTTGVGDCIQRLSNKVDYGANVTAIRQRGTGFAIVNDGREGMDEAPPRMTARSLPVEKRRWQPSQPSEMVSSATDN
jgi:hypothetical protein